MEDTKSKQGGMRMTKTHFNPNLYALPTSQLILGTHIMGIANFMALAWASRVNFQPPLIAISVNKNNMSHEAIKENGEFSLSMPSSDMVALTDYVGLVSAKRIDKSKLFDIFYGELKSAPLIQQCPLNLELRLYRTVDLPTNSVFIGELVGTWCNEDCLTDGVPDVAKIKPFILTMPDNRFWELGHHVGNAWKDGKQIKKKPLGR
jgi:flavin reductase (DIM6/NTAB) family NADH-FMN oxidoreductase RutF